jgi:hypothetical protein
LEGEKRKKNLEDRKREDEKQGRIVSSHVSEIRRTRKTRRKKKI